MASNPTILKKAIDLSKGVVKLCSKIREMSTEHESLKIAERLFEHAMVFGEGIGEVTNGIAELMFNEKLREAYTNLVDVEFLLSLCLSLGLADKQEVSQIKKQSTDLRRLLKNKINSDLKRTEQTEETEETDPFFNPHYSEYFDFTLLEEDIEV